MLNDFLKETKGMEVYIVGSLLLSKLEANYPYQTKAKALYTIEFLLKNLFYTIFALLGFFFISFTSSVY